MLITWHLCVCVDLRTNSNFCLIHHQQIGVYNRSGDCLQRGRLRLKCDGTRAETRFRLSAKLTNPFKSTRWASVQLTTGSRGVRIGGSNAGYTMFRGTVKGTGYPLHSPVSPSLPLPCVTVCHHISTGVFTSSLINISPSNLPIRRIFFPFVAEHRW